MADYEEGESGSFDLVSPEEIRSEKFTFNIVILMHVNRLMTNIYNTVEANSADSLLALQGQIMSLDSLIGSIVRKYDKEQSEHYRNLLNENYNKIYGSRDDKFAYFLFLEEYLNWVISQFKYVPKMFPSRPITMVAGKGMVENVLERK
jgi:hypothetical protein